MFSLFYKYMTEKSKDTNNFNNPSTKVNSPQISPSPHWSKRQKEWEQTWRLKTVQKSAKQKEIQEEEENQTRNRKYESESEHYNSDQKYEERPTINHTTIETKEKTNKEQENSTNTTEDDIKQNPTEDDNIKIITDYNTDDLWSKCPPEVSNISNKDFLESLTTKVEKETQTNQKRRNTKQKDKENKQDK